MRFVVSFNTPVVVRVNQRNSITSTEKSKYEVGESSRRTKRSKRHALESRTPIRFNLSVDDGDVTKEYDKYFGVSDGILLNLHLISL